MKINSADWSTMQDLAHKALYAVLATLALRNLAYMALHAVLAALAYMALYALRDLALLH